MIPVARDVSDMVGPFLSGQLEIVPLQKDLSRRTYYGVSSAAGERVILCIHADPSDPAIADFVSISDFLERGGIPVPRVLDRDQTKGWVLQTDAGGSDLCSAPDTVRRGDLYPRLIHFIVLMQALKPESPVKDRAFDEPRLKQETAFFRAQLAEVGPGIGIPALPFEFSMFLESVCEKLATIGDLVFTHRDLHSKNIMLGSNDLLTLIDFQDARMGLPWYDLASLLYDPYLDMGPAQRKHLLRQYAKMSGRPTAPNLFYLQALQRTVKAMGTYLSVIGQTRSPFYLTALKTALVYLEEIVQLGGFPDHGFVYAIEARAAAEKLHW